MTNSPDTPEFKTADLDSLSLSVPHAMPEIPAEKAQEMVRSKNVHDDAKSKELSTKASSMMTRIEDIDPNSPEFQIAMNKITDLGKQDALMTSKVSSSLLARKDLSNSPTSKKVASSLTELRATITELDPNRNDLTGFKKPLKYLSKIKGGNKVEKYFHKFETSQEKLDGIVASLDSGQFDLKADNKSLNEEQQRLWDAMARLDDAGETLTKLDASLEDRIAELHNAGEDEKAEALKTNALFPVRQRRQDVATELAVATQGYMSIGLLLENNDQLIKGVERAKTTTVAALYTAVIVSQALDRQKMVLDQVTALRDTTSNMIESTSKQMREQGAEINAKSSEAMIDVDKLRSAFDNVYATMDAVDGYKSAATESMKATISSLQSQIDRAQQHVEQTHNQIAARDQRENSRVQIEK